MDARLAARLERLRALTESDLAALPDRATSPKPVCNASAEGGGVSLDHVDNNTEQESRYAV